MDDLMRREVGKTTRNVADGLEWAADQIRYLGYLIEFDDIDEAIEAVEGVEGDEQ